MKKFTNTGDRLWDGGTCETGGGTCDNIFELCVKSFPPLPASANDNCLYHRRTSYFEATTVDFERTSTGIDRDIVLKFDRYTVMYFLVLATEALLFSF